MPAKKNLGRNLLFAVLIVLIILAVLLAAISNVNNSVDKNIFEISENISNFTAEVMSIIDGDTFYISGGDKVRLICIDAPEFGESGYWEARNFLESRINGKNITLIKDISEKDSYGRLLRYPYL